VDVTGAGRTFTYDANGNLTSDGTRSFEWDARNQLVAVNVGTERSEFSYDGLQRRVRIVEKENGVTQSDARVVWCEDEICEERGVDGVTVTRRPFTHGEQAGGVARFFGVDHLGSVGEVTDTASTLVGRYVYDPWGRRTLTSGTDVTTVGFTGHRWHSPAGLWLALYRGYDADLARWTVEDPSGFVDGPNLYTYVRNTPVGLIDPLGLESEDACADTGNPEELKKCLKACDDGTKGREKYCRSLKNPRLRAGCWALVYGSRAACKGWCYWQFGD
jgi:RHS repeat-associated protein